MIEDLKVILQQGKSTLIKGKQFLSAKDYIEPFVDRLNPLNPVYRCMVKQAEQQSITDNTVDIVYNRVHIQAILPKEYYYKNDNQKVIGMIYGLDTKTPVAKFYIADMDINKNIIIFDSNQIIYQEIEDSTALDYTGIQGLIESTDINDVMLENLKKAYYDRSRVHEMLGDWVDYLLTNSYVSQYGKVSLATTVPIKVYKALYKDKDADSYISDEDSITLYKIYKAFSKILTEEDDLINVIEKTLLINKMLGI